MQNQLHACHRLNRHGLGKVNLKNSSPQSIYTCYFGEELRMCVLKIAVLQEKRLKVIFWKFLENHGERILF